MRMHISVYLCKRWLLVERQLQQRVFAFMPTWVFTIKKAATRHCYQCRKELAGCCRKKGKATDKFKNEPSKRHCHCLLQLSILCARVDSNIQQPHVVYRGVKTRIGNIVSRKIWTVWTQVRRCPQPQHGNLLRLPHASKLPCMKPGRLRHCKILHIPSCKEKEMLRRNMKKWLKKLNVSMTFNDHHNEHAQHDPHNIA